MHEPAAVDDALMRAVAAGDPDAREELVRRHRQWVRSLLGAILRDGDTAEDLTQDVFCRVFRSAEAYSGRGSFVPWLKTIAVNMARDHLRRRLRAPMPLAEVEEGLASEPRADWAAALHSSALREELRDAIQQLPDPQRLCLVMHYFGGMELQEVAWAMKCPVGTVKSRLFHGLRRVRALVLAARAECGGDPDER